MAHELVRIWQIALKTFFSLQVAPELKNLYKLVQIDRQSHKPPFYALESSFQESTTKQPSEF